MSSSLNSEYFKLGDNSYYPKERIVPKGKSLGCILPNRMLRPPHFFNKGKNIPDARVEEVERVIYGDRVVLTERIQWFIFNDNYNRCPEWKNPEGLVLAQKDFIYMLDEDLAYCNFAGSENRKVYPSNHNMNINAVPLWNEITMPGIVELVSGIPVQRGILKEPMIEYKVINAQDPNIEKYNSTDYPYLWHRPNNIIWEHKENGKTIPEGNEPFGRFLNRIKMPNMVNYTNTAFINPRMIQVLRPGELIPNTAFTKDW